jgi:hypothetical protein
MGNTDIIVLIDTFFMSPLSSHDKIQRNLLIHPVLYMDAKMKFVSLLL